MMFSWMSVVPPPIVSASVSSTCRDQCAPDWPPAPRAERGAGPGQREAELGHLLRVAHAEQLAHAAGRAGLGP